MQTLSNNPPTAHRAYASPAIGSVKQDAVPWGVQVWGGGYAEIESGKTYPSHEHEADAEDSASREHGRMLSRYQLVYISEGEGRFENAETELRGISAGDLFFLHPGIWHRYSPVKSVGWTESWISFTGDVADRIMDAFFLPKHAVFHLGLDQELLSLIQSVSGLMEDRPLGYQQLAAARVSEALALVRAISIGLSPAGHSNGHKMQKACEYLTRHAAEEINMAELAKDLGLSYSRFRSLFKDHTGLAPHQYKLNILFNKSQYLLKHTTLSISEIAYKLGFTSAYYFSRLFKRRMGCPPSAYRK